MKAAHLLLHHNLRPGVWALPLFLKKKKTPRGTECPPLQKFEETEYNVPLIVHCIVMGLSMWTMNGMLYKADIYTTKRQMEIKSVVI